MNSKSSVLTGIEDFRANPADPTPLYLQLANTLRRLVDAGVLQEGDALPPERRIHEQTTLSRVTVRKALQLLVGEALLERKRGSGTFVSRGLQESRQSMPRLSSFTEEMISRGRVPSVRWIEKYLTLPNSEEAMLFGLSPGNKVVHLRRLRYGDGVPMAVDFATVPATYIPDPSVVEDSLYRVLSKVNARPVRAAQRLEARALPTHEARLLEATAGAPALYIEQASRLADGTLVEFTRSYYRSDTYDLVAELSIAADDMPRDAQYSALESHV